jgi:hypothetical protein
MRNPRAAVPALLAALLAGFVLAGCGSDEEVVINNFSPDIVAVTAPDTVAAGQPLDVKIHWRARTTCQELTDFGFVVFDDTTFQITALGKETVKSDQVCESIAEIREASYRIPDPPARRFHVQVYGLQHFDLGVVGGVTPAAVERHSVLVQTSTGGAVGPEPVVGAVAKVVAGATDTLLVLVTGLDGTADSSLVCPGPARAYNLFVRGSGGRTVTLPFQQNPARCGVAERTHTLF